MFCNKIHLEPPVGGVVCLSVSAEVFFDFLYCYWFVVVFVVAVASESECFVAICMVLAKAKFWKKRSTVC